MKIFISLVALSLHLPAVLGRLKTLDANNCTCGFFDPVSDLWFTDASIVYFNETPTMPTSQYLVEDFEHMYDIGWNTVYRQGAKSDNVEIAKDLNTYAAPQGAALHCDPGTQKGLVPGASIRTARQDIFYGSFRASMKAPWSWIGGSALSMKLFHNKTERWDLDIYNTLNQSQAWVAMLTNGEFANTWLGTNFTNLTEAGMQPWGYLEYRVDWTPDRMDFYIQPPTGEPIPWKTYTNNSLPRTPAPLQFQHWSTGNNLTVMGPPKNRTEANIAYTRLFFNSSLANDTSREQFAARCSKEAACLMDNNSLRNYTHYDPAALEPWTQYNKPWTLKGIWPALLVVIVFSGIFTFVTVKTVYRRFSWDELNYFLGRKKREVKPSIPRPASPSASETSTSAETTTTYVNTPHTSQHQGRSTSQDITNGSLHGRYPRVASFSTLTPPPGYSGVNTPAPHYQTPATSAGPTRVNSVDDLAIEPMPLPGHGNLPRNDSASSNLYMAGRGTKANRIAEVRSGEGSRALQHYGSTSNPFLPRVESNVMTPEPETNPGGFFPIASLSSTVLQSVPTESIKSLEAADKKSLEKPIVVAKENEMKATAVAVAAGDKAPLVRQRIDYLAGFISFSAILVTLNHFGQTYWDAVINPAARPHYISETWARKTFATVFLDPLWIGPFLMISTRFLVSNYLRTGKLDNMAQKVVSRPFRLLTPVVFIATLEYFLTDSGALNWLEYLASVTWSQWPFTSIVANPGVFISELLQLAYLIPNAAPNITYNYSTGVLWTIPVQLQGAWQTLLALIMVKECKTPWKRFAFYAFCIVNHWYALSWGSYYYAGVMLADLDLTFKYKTWLYAKWWRYYPVLYFLILCVKGGFVFDMVNSWAGVQLATIEYGWHPDIPTGLPLSQIGKAVYPDYFIPRLNALVVTVGMQLIVEISPIVQWVLSIKPLQWLFPHVFTIYLIHGFIFWSVGSWACITLFSYGLPYWAAGLLTGVICYFTLFACLPLLTPPIEAVGKNFTLSLWEHASQEPVPRKPTTFPFGEDLLKRDVEGARATESLADDSSNSIGEKSDPFKDPDQKRSPFADPTNPFADPPKKKGPVFERIEEV